MKRGGWVEEVEEVGEVEEVEGEVVGMGEEDEEAVVLVAPPATTGRGKKLTPEVHQAIVQAVSAGVPFKQSCEMMGVSEKTGLAWLQRGEGRHPTRPGRQEHVDFAEGIRKAEAEDVARRLARIAAAGKGGQVIWRKTTTYPDGRVVEEVKVQPGQWSADAWHLERTRPMQFTKLARVDTRLEVQEAVKRVAAEAGLTEEEVIAEAQRILVKAQD